jgi:hypothetical protein
MGQKQRYQAMEMFDPGRFFHDAQADKLSARDQDFQNRWSGLLGESDRLGKAGIDSARTEGWNGTLDAARNPENTQLLTGSRDYNNRILSGEFLDPNSNLALAQQLQRGYEGIGGWDSSAEAAGRYGSGTWAEGRGREMADLKANLYGQGLDRMERASNNAGAIYGQQFAPSQMIGAVGQERDDANWGLLGNRANMLGAAQSGMPQQTYSGNKVMGAVGTALSVVGAVKGMGGGAKKQPNVGIGDE